MKFIFTTETSKGALTEKSEWLYSRGQFRLGGKEPDESPLLAMSNVVCDKGQIMGD